MSKYEWILGLKHEDLSGLLSPESKIFIDKYGIEAFIGLYETFGGNTVYFSEVEINKLKKMIIKKEFNGSNLQALAKKLNCSDAFVRNAVKEIYSRKENI